MRNTLTAPEVDTEDPCLIEQVNEAIHWSNQPLLREFPDKWWNDDHVGAFPSRVTPYHLLLSCPQFLSPSVLVGLTWDKYRSVILKSPEELISQDFARQVFEAILDSSRQLPPEVQVRLLSASSSSLFAKGAFESRHLQQLMYSLLTPPFITLRETSYGRRIRSSMMEVFNDVRMLLSKGGVFSNGIIPYRAVAVNGLLDSEMENARGISQRVMEELREEEAEEAEVEEEDKWGDVETYFGENNMGLIVEDEEVLDKKKGGTKQFKRILKPSSNRGKLSELPVEEDIEGITFYREAPEVIVEAASSTEDTELFPVGPGVVDAMTSLSGKSLSPEDRAYLDELSAECDDLLGMSTRWQMAIEEHERRKAQTTEVFKVMDVPPPGFAEDTSSSQNRTRLFELNGASSSTSRTSSGRPEDPLQHQRMLLAIEEARLHGSASRNKDDVEAEQIRALESGLDPEVRIALAYEEMARQQGQQNTPQRRRHPLDGKSPDAQVFIRRIHDELETERIVERVDESVESDPMARKKTVRKVSRPKPRIDNADDETKPSFVAGPSEAAKPRRRQRTDRMSRPHSQEEQPGRRRPTSRSRRIPADTARRVREEVAGLSETAKPRRRQKSDRMRRPHSQEEQLRERRPTSRSRRIPADTVRKVREEIADVAGQSEESRMRGPSIPAQRRRAPTEKLSQAEMMQVAAQSLEQSRQSSGSGTRQVKRSRRPSGRHQSQDNPRGRAEGRQRPATRSTQRPATRSVQRTAGPSLPDPETGFTESGRLPNVELQRRIAQQDQEKVKRRRPQSGRKRREA